MEYSTNPREWKFQRFFYFILDEDFLDEMTEEHNKLRSIHLSPPLVKNRNMSLQAKALAIQLAAEANLRHSDKTSRPDQGENLAMGCTSSGPGITAKDAAKEWLGLTTVFLDTRLSK